MNYLYEPIFHKKWNKYILYDLATWTNGLAFRDFEFTNRGKPIIKIAELKHGISPETKYTTQSFALCYYITKGDMLFSWSGSPDTSIDIFWWRNIDGWLNQHTFKVEPNSMCDRIFFYYILKYLKPLFIEIARNKQTTGLGHVTIKDLKSMYVSLPPLPIQQRIAEILGALDDKIECNRRVNETLEKMAMALYKHWFVDFGPFRDGEFEETELGMVPKGWSIGKLGDYITVSKGLSYKGSGLSDKGLPLHNLNSVYEGGGYKYSGIKYYTGEYKDRHIVYPGDVIVANTEQGFDYLLIGCPAIIPRHYGEFGIFTHHIYLIRPIDNGVITPHFIYLLLRDEKFRQEVTSYTNGTTVNMLSADGLKRPIIILPTKNIMKYFQDKVVPLFELMETNYEEEVKLTKTRDYLLPKLLSGEIEVKAAEKQVSEVI